MAHSLIVGMTESGKTTLAKQFCKSSQDDGIKTIVLDPMHDVWNADYQTDNTADFLDMFFSSRNCNVFIDEAGEMIGHYDELMKRVATKGRHWGHNVYFLTQRSPQLSPTVRGQCRHLFLFVSDFAACKIHAQELNCPELVQAVNFEVGEFFHKPRHGELARYHLFKES